MSKTKINAALGAILEALNDGDGPIPEGAIHESLRSFGFDDPGMLVGLLVGGGLVDRAGYRLTITDQGKEVAAKVVAARTSFGAAPVAVGA